MVAAESVEQGRRSRVVDVTPQLVADFRIGTLDYNKVHEGEHAIALGFQLELLAVRMYGGLQSDGFFYQGQSTKFKNVVPVGTRIILKEETCLSTEGRDYVVGVNIVRTEDNILAAQTQIRFSKQRSHDDAGTGGVEYVLSADNVRRTMSGLEEVGCTDAAPLALALASHALQEGARRNSSIFGVLASKVPVYISHRVTAFAPLHDVCIGDPIFLRAGLSDVPRRDIYSAEVVASTTAGSTLYTLDAKLAFVTEIPR